MIKMLIKKACQMRDSAYCPYSNYRVGAAVLADGKIFTGCNIENASYSAGICAERTAAAKAVSEGCLKFEAVAIAVFSDDYAYPCGICRQFLSEFASSQMEIYLINKYNHVRKELFAELFPHSFSKKDLNK